MKSSLPAIGPEELPAPPDESLRQALRKWFEANRRQLPWRAYPFQENARPSDSMVQEDASLPRRDPYATWISEIMLQQTQVATVVQYFVRWMKAFPDISHLARAPEDKVLSHWAGLGYYSRARNLHAAAKELDAIGGQFPNSREKLLALKGIGDYTAGAILSLAMNLPEAILDGNLVRVFARLHALGTGFHEPEGKALYWGIARDWACGDRPGDTNEALMELGALVCKPKEPICEACPLRESCLACRSGRQSSFPIPKPRKEVRNFRGFAWIVRNSREKVLLHRPSKPSLLSGLWTFPLVESETVTRCISLWEDTYSFLGRAEIRSTGQGRIRHSITSNRFSLGVLEARVDGQCSPEPGFNPKHESGSLPEDYRWASMEELEGLLVSSLPQKLWQLYRNESRQPTLF